MLVTAIERIYRLIETGQEVLETDRPEPTGRVGFPTLDFAAFAAWRTQCLNFLKAELKLPPANSYVTGFQDAVRLGGSLSSTFGKKVLRH